MHNSRNKWSLGGVEFDDRVMLYGASLGMADKLRSDDDAHASALWRRLGARAFEKDLAAAEPAQCLAPLVHVFQRVTQRDERRCNMRADILDVDVEPTR